MTCPLTHSKHQTPFLPVSSLIPIPIPNLLSYHSLLCYTQFQLHSLFYYSFEEPQRLLALASAYTACHPNICMLQASEMPPLYKITPPPLCALSPQLDFFFRALISCLRYSATVRVWFHSFLSAPPSFLAVVTTCSVTAWISSSFSRGFFLCLEKYADHCYFLATGKVRLPSLYQMFLQR